jgi:hypothetical protein
MSCSIFREVFDACILDRGRKPPIVLGIVYGNYVVILEVGCTPQEVGCTLFYPGDA